jgi:hypothetical protein
LGPEDSYLGSEQGVPMTVCGPETWNASYT